MFAFPKTVPFIDQQNHRLECPVLRGILLKDGRTIECLVRVQAQLVYVYVEERVR
jgi:hypothetical protein